MFLTFFAAHAQSPGKALRANELAFSAFAQSTAATTDPADSVCARYAAGSTIAEPPTLTSQNGTLEVTFKFQTVVDAAGLTRYCFVTDTGVESPTLIVNPGDKLIIHFTNDIPASQTSSEQMPGMKMHLSEDDKVKANDTSSSTDAACNVTTMQSTFTNMHFHGFNVAPTCHQDEVIHTLIQPGQTFDYSVDIPANEPPGLYWYHPHPHGYSEAQVLGGASGAIVVQGIQNFDTDLANLPEKTIVLRDQPVAYTGTDSSVTKPENDISINYVPILYPTNTPAVMQVAPSETEFWRVLNASADTVFNLQVMVGSTAQTLKIVAVDGVPVKDSNGNPAPITATNYVVPPAGRVEFTLTTPASGQTATLVSQTWDTGPQGKPDPGRTLANIQATASTTSSSVVAQSARTGQTAQTVQTVSARRLPQTTHPQRITRFAALDTVSPTTTRTIYFSTDLSTSPAQFLITVDGQTPAVFDMNAAPALTIQDGTVEQWTIQNRSQMDHAFHIHQIHFQTLAINGQTVNDPTMRDTINVPHWSGNSSDPYPSVTLLMDFRDPNIVGTFVYHCHVLSHEDLGMMAAIQVNPATTTTALTATPTSALFGAPVTLTATVSASTTTPPTGTVTFYNGTTALGTGTLDNTGTATFTASNLPVGTDSITAQYTATTSFAASTSSAVSVTVSPAATTTTLTPSATTLTAGSNVTLTATVATGNAAIPAGTVTFLNGTTALGTGTLDSTGTATFTTNALPVGSDSITAQYAATASFAASASSPVVITVNAPPAADFTIALNPGTLTLTPTAMSGATTLTITPANGFNSALSFSCTGLPAGAQCSFSPQTVTPDGTNSTTTKITVVGAASSAMLQHERSGLPRTFYGFVLPGLGMMLGLVARRRKNVSRGVRFFSALLILTAAAVSITACGGGSTKSTANSGTPAGTSTVTVTATCSGAGAISHSTNLTLTVQ